MGKHIKLGERIKTYKVGDRFTIDGVEFVVEEVADKKKPCVDCAFCEKDNCTARLEFVGLCYSGMRSDNKQVVFKKVEENNGKEELCNGYKKIADNL